MKRPLIGAVMSYLSALFFAFTAFSRSCFTSSGATAARRNSPILKRL